MAKTCICASALIVVNRKILFLWHEKLGIWLYPGGHNEANETPQQTAIRETLEETGMKITIANPDPASRMINTTCARELPRPFKILYEDVKYKTERHYHFDMIYLAKLRSGKEMKNLGKGETSKVRWVGREEISALETYANVRSVTSVALAGVASNG